MAINIEWQIMPPNKKKGADKPLMYPRITDSEVIDEQQLAKRMAAHGALSKGQAEAAINDLADVMAKLLAEGKTIDISMLGTFKLSIGTHSQIHPDSEKRMQSIEVRGVNFHPYPQFIQAIEKPCFQWRPSTGIAIAPTADKLIPLLDNYFKTHDHLTRSAFEQLSGLKRTTAYNRLKEMEQMGIIHHVGSGRDTKYVK